VKRRWCLLSVSLAMPVVFAAAVVVEVAEVVAAVVEGVVEILSEEKYRD
jgi:hypothetical protein